MTSINAIRSSAVAVPSFGKGEPVQGPSRAEFDTLRMDKLAESVLARHPLLLQDLASKQPQLRTPEASVDAARVSDVLAFIATQHAPADELMERSYERHVRAAETSAEDAMPQDALPAQRITLDEFFPVLAEMIRTMREQRARDREQGVKMVEVSMELTKHAAQNAKEQVQKQMFGAVAAGVIATAASAAAVSQTAKSAKITTDGVNQNPLPKAPAASTTPGTGTASSTPRSLASDGLDVPTQSAPDVPDTLPTSTPAAPAANANPATNAPPDSQALADLKAERDAAMLVVNAKAQLPLSRSHALTALAAPTSNIAATGGQLAGAADEAERLQQQASADVARQVFTSQNEQATHDGEIREAIFQAIQTLWAHRQEALGGIIRNM